MQRTRLWKNIQARVPSQKAHDFALKLKELQMQTVHHDLWVQASSRQTCKAHTFE